VLKYILVNGRVSEHTVRAAEEVSRHFEHFLIVNSSLGRCVSAGLLDREAVAKPFDVTEYWVKPDLAEALSFWLIERHGDLRPSSEDRLSPTPRP